MLRHRATILTLPLLALAVGCNSGGSSGGGKRALSTVGGVTSATGLAVTATPAVSADALMAPDAAALALALKANGAAIEVQSLTLHASGSVDESVAIGAVTLYGDDDRDGKVTAGEQALATAAAPAFAADDGSVTLTLATPITIAAGATLNVVVAVDATATGAAAMARIGETIALQVTAATSIQADAGGQPATVTGAFPLGAPVSLGLHDHLLISEIVGDPEASEFFELFNPTGRTIDLSDVYFTDADDLSDPKAVEYYNLPTGADYGPDNAVADFMVRFPAGATIAPGACVTVATEGVGFLAAYGKAADYCTREPAGGSVQMLTSAGGNVWTATETGPSTSLFPSGEPIVLFTWDGQSDLVQDLDMVFLGTKSTSGANDPHDKTGVAVDGPDADTTPSVYAAETPAAQQASVRGNIVQRIDFTEGSERKTAGNGVTGHDETSEPVDVTFITATRATPGTP